MKVLLNLLWTGKDQWTFYSICYEQVKISEGCNHQCFERVLCSSVENKALVLLMLLLSMKPGHAMFQFDLSYLQAQDIKKNQKNIIFY